MKRLSKLNWLHRLVLTGFISLAVVFLGWFIVPALPIMGAQPTQVFDKVWQTIDENFYDPNFNGVDWKAMRQKYKPQFTQAQSKEAAAIVINQMLAELKTSHTYYYTPDEPAYYQILGIFQPRDPGLLKPLKNQFPKGKIEYSGIGILTKTINGNTFISGVLEGSPAAKSGLTVGDQLLSVDDKPFQPIASFAGKAGQAVIVQVQRSPNTAPQNISVTPKLFDTTTMFLDAQKASTQVIERQGKKIGYVHIWSYAGDQYQQQLEEDLLYDRLSDTDGFVLDLRDGWGGAPLTALNIYTAQGPSVTSIPRNGRKYVSSAQWKKPVVMLVNQGSRSAKEILAYGFQKYNIGPVVGTTTAGYVVAGRPFVMPDGSLLYVAVANVYVDGTERLEGKGVTPNVVVPFSVEYAQGADPQRERAIEVALDTIKQRGK